MSGLPRRLLLPEGGDRLAVDHHRPGIPRSPARDVVFGAPPRDRLFAGNPAAVCPLAAWLPDARLQAIAAENNLSP